MAEKTETESISDDKGRTPLSKTEQVSPARFEFLALSLIVLIGGIMRMYAINSKSLWVDELEMLRRSGSLSAIANYIKHGFTPPLRYLLTYCCSVLLNKDLLIRLPSAVAGILTIIVVYRLVSRMLSKKIACASALLLMFSPWHLFHSQDGRMHTVAMLFVFLAFYCGWRFFAESGSIRYFWFFVLHCIIALYITFAILLFLATAFFIFLMKVLISELDPTTRRIFIRKEARRKILCLVIGGVLLVVSVLPLALYTRFDEILTGSIGVEVTREIEEEQPLQAPENLEVTKVLDPIYYRPYSTLLNIEFYRLLVRKLTFEGREKWFYLAFSLIGSISLFVRSRTTFAVVAMWIALPILIVFCTPMRHHFYQRYLFCILPIFLVTVGAGMAWIAGVLFSDRLWRGILKRKELWTFVMIALVAGGVSAKQIRRYYRTEKQNWRGAMEYLSKEVRDGDVVVTGSHWAELGVIYYVKNDPSKRVLLVTECFDIDKFQELVKKHDSLWYIYWVPPPPELYAILYEYFDHKRKFYGDLGIVTIGKKKEGK